MKKVEYEKWLQTQKYQANTITTQLHRASRVEESYGDLDEHFKADQLASVIAALVYSTEDRRRNRPNLTKIPFQGDPYNNLASYRDAVRRYQRFRILQADVGVLPKPVVNENELGQRIGLERDMQAALRLRIDQLEPDLKIIDEGDRKSVV